LALDFLSKHFSHSFAACFLERLHHFLYFAELLNKAIHILHLHAAARRDTPPP
jgi:hypothetical protein